MTQSGHQGPLTQPRVFFFFLWWYLKSKVFKTLPIDRLGPCMNDLLGRIIIEVDALRGQQVMIRYLFQGMRARAKACV